MIYLKWIALVLLDIVMLLSNFFVAPVLSLFTKAEPDLDENGEPWGGWYGTWDNPPQGDEGWVTERSPFPNVLTGWRGWWNRTKWLYRNPCYGYQRWAGIPYKAGLRAIMAGDMDISDKHRRPGSYFVRLYDGQKLVGFEYYLVKPYREDKCLRVRLGWKIATDKFERYGFATLVDTVQPFKAYGG